jgi:hypothetical protein
MRHILHICCNKAIQASLAMATDDNDYRSLHYPPEAQTFDSWQEAWEYCRDFAQNVDMVSAKAERVKTLKSKEDIIIQCDRKETPNATNSVRQTSRGTSAKVSGVPAKVSGNSQG